MKQKPETQGSEITPAAHFTWKCSK